MAAEAAIGIAAAAIEGLLPAATELAINAFDKMGFDMDTTGRERQAQV
jgi:hypothetical protein